MKERLYSKIAGTLQAYKNCIESGNKEWEEKHEETLEKLVDKLPSGAGIDSGIELNFEESKINKLVFNFSFHHMDEMGGYDGWTDHKLIVKPDLYFGAELIITGRNKNQIKEYLSDIFYPVLFEEVE